MKKLMMMVGLLLMVGCGSNDKVDVAVEEEMSWEEICELKESRRRERQEKQAEKNKKIEELEKYRQHMIDLNDQGYKIINYASEMDRIDRLIYDIKYGE